MGAASRAAVTALGAAVVALAGYLSRDLLTALILALCLVFAAGWPRLIGLPTTRGAGVVIAAVAVAATAVVRLGSVAGLAVVVGLAVIGAFVHQMLRRDGRPRLVESVSGVVTGCAVVVSAAGWSAPTGGLTLASLTVTGAASIAAAAVCTALPVRTELGAALATVVAGVAGLVTGWALDAVGGLLRAAGRPRRRHPHRGAARAVRPLPRLAAGAPGAGRRGAAPARPGHGRSTSSPTSSAADRPSLPGPGPGASLGP